MLTKKELSSEYLTVRLKHSLKERISLVTALYESLGYNKSDIVRVAIEEGLNKLESDYRILEFQKRTKIKAAKKIE